MPPQPTPPQPPSPPQTVADIKAEREYQRLLAHRVRQQQLQKRLQEDLARLARPQVEAEQAMARSAPGRLRELEARRALAREELAVARQVREMDLRQRYGRVGGLLAGAERFGQSRVGQVLGAGATAFGAFAGNAARSGFSGTVEQARNDYARERLGRQFAGVMSPVLNAMTYATTEIERRMRGMGSAEQNRLMGAIVGGGLGMRYGPLGAIAGAGLGALAMDGSGGAPSTSDRLMAIGAGAYAGYRIGGPVGAAAGAGAGAAATSGDYRMMRDLGASRGLAALSSASFAAVDVVSAIGSPFGMTNPLDDARLRGQLEVRRRQINRTAPEEPRRDVTPFQTEMTEAGGLAGRIQQGIIRATAGAGFEEDGGPFKPLIDLGLKIYDVLALILLQAGGTVPPPAPAMSSR